MKQIREWLIIVLGSIGLIEGMILLQLSEKIRLLQEVNTMAIDNADECVDLAYSASMLANYYSCQVAYLRTTEAGKFLLEKAEPVCARKVHESQ